MGAAYAGLGGFHKESAESKNRDSRKITACAGKKTPNF